MEPQMPEVVVVEEQRPRTFIRVSMSSAELPRVDYCCMFLDLRVGLAIWLVTEALIWSFLFFAAFAHEIIWAEKIDLLEFSDATKGWYHYLIFGDEATDLDQRKRTYILLFNLVLMLIFLTYLAFCLVLLLGIKMRKTCFFIPYFVLDMIFSLIAFVACFVGLILSYNHLFRMSFIFLLLKVYVEICAVSLFLQIRREKAKIPATYDASGIVYQDTQASAV